MNFANVKEWRIPEGDVLRVTRNNIVLWEKQTGPDYTEPFYVENVSNDNEYLKIIKSNSSAPTLTIEYSTDKATWSTLGTTSTTALTHTLQPGDKLYLRCNTPNWCGIVGVRNIIIGISKVGGNIMSLLYGSNFTGNETTFPTNNGYEFYRGIFNDGSSSSKLENASELLLPATTLTNYCYYGLFSGCTLLTSAPALPATILAERCYQNMFWGCTSLTTAPALPAATLVNSCYTSMFHGCTLLTTPPELPATTLAISCYSDMFNGCTSLTTAPVLPATTLTYSCYYEMFRDCTSLTTVPALPATTLADYCYFNMFNSCTSLTAAPVLPAAALANYCYANMFNGCTSLTTAPVLPATTLNNDCYNSMFFGCTSLTTAPVLPATTLADYCYFNMFNGCTSLTTAPDLLAPTLVNNCYSAMFGDCTSLNGVKCLATTNVSSGNLANWLRNVSVTGTFTKAAGVTWASGDSGIPSGWTVVEV